MIFAIAQDAFWSAVASLGFAVLFNVPPRLLLTAAILGAVGHSTRRVLELSGSGIEIGTLIGAVVVGFAGYYMAKRRLHVPTLILTIPASIPLVPGAFAYRAMIGLLQMTAAPPEAISPLLVEVAVNGVRTGIILAALAAGIAAPSLLLERQKPVV
jgi:uncharacterized membrane protein YjjB (DUF3815 family)